MRENEKEKKGVIVQEKSQKQKVFDYETAEKLKKEKVWQGLGAVTLAQAVELFLKTFHLPTAKAYGLSFKRIFFYRLLDPKMSLKSFSLLNLDSKLDQIKENLSLGSEATRQIRSAAFLSFTRFLHRKTEGMIHKALPNREKGKKTFQKIREKTICKTLTSEELKKFLSALRKVSLRNYLIGAMQVQGAKRISEVLDAKVDDIDWKGKKILFKQRKSDILEKQTTVFFPDSFIKDLKKYIGKRATGLIFLSATGKKLSREGVRHIYVSAYKKVGITYFKSVTHILRATGITELSKQGFRAEEIISLTGHSSLEMIGYYDKSGDENNPSRKSNLTSWNLKKRERNKCAQT